MCNKLTSKKISLYGLLTALALIFGYVEFLLPLNFIAPGVKLGVANAVFLILLLKGKIKAAVIINISRIVLSALLFATPFSLVFSLTAGVVSMLFMIFAARLKKVGAVGISVVGGTLHNLTQLIVANLTVGQAVWFYMPFLLVAGLIAGTAVGFISWLVCKKIPDII